MFRRKPPQLLLFEELQLTYNDVCNFTIKNLNLEESGQFEDALKGWKSLHTSLLYKTDVFDKQLHKLLREEIKILDDLKGIRDENVKHLIRVQLRIDEKTRRASKDKKPVTASKPAATPPSRAMLKSLRSKNGFSTPKPSTPQHKPKVNTASKAAASLSWQKPKPVVTQPEEDEEDDVFRDFDQDSFEFSNNWDRVDSFTSQDSQNTQRSPRNRSEPNLIDLDDGYFAKNRPVSPNPPNIPAIQLPTKSQSVQQLTQTKSQPSIQQITLSMESMGKPPIPPKRSTLKPTKPSYMSKSTSDIAGEMKSEQRTYSTSPPQKRYVYKQPKPMDIGQLMKANQKRPAKKSNILYNYKIIPKEKQKNPKERGREKPVERVERTERSDRTDKEKTENVGDVENTENPESSEKSESESEAELIKSLRGVDPTAAKQILNDIVVHGDEVYWDDIVGLEGAKNSLKEAVVYPFLRPDLFQGLREPTRGMLLFGPPGTGKTMLARAVATESKSTFFSISSSSLTSKYLGESEKLVKALFLMARKMSPSIVFIDEIDSLLSSRNEGEIESSRRIKNEFLVQWSELSSAAAGRSTQGEDATRVLILGATNLPWSIDEAARRRFVKRQYIPLPEPETRKAQIIKLLAYQNHSLSDEDFQKLMDLTEGFSGSDITALAKDSAMGPLRSLGEKLLTTPTEQIREIQLQDFIVSLNYIRPSVSKEGLDEYEKWAEKFGSSGV